MIFCMVRSTQNTKEGDRVWCISQVICLRASREARGPQNTQTEMLPVSEIIHRTPSTVQPWPPYSAPSSTTPFFYLPHLLPRLQHKSGPQDIPNPSGLRDRAFVYAASLPGGPSLTSHLVKFPWLFFPGMAQGYFLWTSFSSKPHLIHLHVPSILHRTQNLQTMNDLKEHMSKMKYKKFNGAGQAILLRVQSLE